MEEIMSRIAPVPANTETKVAATLSQSEASLVREKSELLVPVKRVTDEQIASAIRYLDPDPGSERPADDGTVLVICFGLLILLIAAVPFIWLYLQTAR
jgi:hypothetical protein